MCCWHDSKRANTPCTVLYHTLGPETLWCRISNATASIYTLNAYKCHNCMSLPFYTKFWSFFWQLYNNLSQNHMTVWEIVVSGGSNLHTNPQDRISFESWHLQLNFETSGRSARLIVWLHEVSEWKLNLCPIHVVTFTLISNLATDYIKKRRGDPGLFSFEYNLSPNLISK